MTRDFPEPPGAASGDDSGRPTEWHTPLRGMLSRNQFIAVASGIAALAIGILVVIWTPGRITVLKWVLGAIFVFVGLSEAIDAIARRSERDAGYWPLLLLRGIIGTIFGALTLAWSDITPTVLAYLIGANLLIYGVLAVAISRMIPSDVEAHSRNLWRGVLAIGIGIVLVVLPERSVFVVALIVGFYLIAFGLLMLVASYQLRRLQDSENGDRFGAADRPAFGNTGDKTGDFPDPPIDPPAALG